MEFIVKRTSVFDDEVKPCEEAFKTTSNVYDQRTFKSEEEYDKKLREPWRSRGTEHGINEIGIFRRLEDRDAWAVKIETMKDLLEFQKKYGSIILREDWNDPSRITIEIYDTYRE